MELMKNKYLNSDKDIYFDTDCLATFLLVGKEEIIEKLFKGKIIIPRQVYVEIEKLVIRKILKTRPDNFVKSSKAEIYDAMINSDEEKLFEELICGENAKAIGSGEAICIALAKTRGGILSSNNLKDICYCIKKYNLEFITTGDILVFALQEKIINFDEGEEIWEMMLKKKRKIGPNSFNISFETFSSYNFKKYLENYNNSESQTHYPCK